MMWKVDMTIENGPTLSDEEHHDFVWLLSRVTDDVTLVRSGTQQLTHVSLVLDAYGVAGAVSAAIDIVDEAFCDRAPEVRVSAASIIRR